MGYTYRRYRPLEVPQLLWTRLATEIGRLLAASAVPLIVECDDP